MHLNFSLFTNFLFVQVFQLFTSQIRWAILNTVINLFHHCIFLYMASLRANVPAEIHWFSFCIHIKVPHPVFGSSIWPKRKKNFIMCSRNRINTSRSRQMPVIKKIHRWYHRRGARGGPGGIVSVECVEEITTFEWWLWQRLISAVGWRGSSNKETVTPSGSFHLKCSLISS